DRSTRVQRVWFERERRSDNAGERGLHRGPVSRAAGRRPRSKRTRGPAREKRAPPGTLAQHVALAPPGERGGAGRNRERPRNRDPETAPDGGEDRLLRSRSLRALDRPGLRHVLRPGASTTRCVSEADAARERRGRLVLPAAGPEAARCRQ